MKGVLLVRSLRDSWLLLVCCCALVAAFICLRLWIASKIKADAILFVAGWLRDRRFPLRLETRAALAGYLLGFLPWLTYNLPRGFPGLSIYGRELFAGSEAASATRSAGGRMLDLGLRYLPDSAAFRDLGVLSGHAMGLFYAWSLVTAFLLALGLSIRSVRREGRASLVALAPVLLLQPLLFSTAYLTTGFKIGGKPDIVGSFRYLQVLLPWLWCGAALGLAGLMRMGRPARTLTRVWIAALVLLAGSGELRLIDRHQWGATLGLPAHSYSAFGRFVLMGLAEREGLIVSAIERAKDRLDDEDLDLFLFGMGMQLKENDRGRAILGPRGESIRARTDELRALVTPHVPLPQRPYFEPAAEGEKPFGAKDRDGRQAFWRWYRTHEASRPRGESDAAD
jgi:hypothetical protein